VASRARLPTAQLSLRRPLRFAFEHHLCAGAPTAASRRSGRIRWGDVCSWHKADIKRRPLFGRYWVESGHHRLVMSISAFDPKQTCWPRSESVLSSASDACGTRGGQNRLARLGQTSSLYKVKLFEGINNRPHYPMHECRLSVLARTTPSLRQIVSRAARDPSVIWLTPNVERCRVCRAH
jgi:hypothetical protein